MASNQTFTLNIKALFDTSDVKNKVGDIQNALKNIKLPDTLKRSLDTSFIGVNKALDDFNSKVSKGVKTKTDATGITRSFDNITKELDNLDKLLLKVKGELGDGVDLSQIIRIDGETKTKVEQLKNEIGELQKKISAITTDKLDSLKEKLDKITSPAASKHAGEAFKLFEEGDVQGAINLLDQIIAKQEQIKKATEAKGNNTSNIQNNIEQLTALRDIMTDTLPEVQQYNDEIGQKGAQAAELLNHAQQQAAQSAKDMADDLHETALGAKEASGKIEELTTDQANFNKEIDQIKSRIQYFFGLSNAINLVKRAIRGAFDTIKELDKAMTETAVVTDFSVSDMWEQLPEYTKRANELGVTTLAAYEAATLYYQQGLKTNEVNALSVETLKMARIAGLDAAEATDRMTNALRGFNMQLTEANAQRVDDVYSELAANTASNVDEISTAMTKVASLAHNANMEFETTAAFLSQIIETTRESAETAGTALKTVVARFSEVKKLVDEGSLRGTDEEGSTIDVNRVGQALRAAGIDLNKYFMGEVGLDDIFMELASKWDTLTSMQQRYIATQAAGSRQQSRFIALMSDYARTQELVGKAYNANGASARQFAKTQESLESKLNRLKNAWNEFLMGLTNNEMVKGFVDVLTNLLNFLNKITTGFDSTTNSVLKFTAALAGFAGLKFLTKSGGPLDTLLSTLLQGTTLGNGLFKSGILSGKIMGGGAAVGSVAAQEAAAAAAGQTVPKGGLGTVIGVAGKGITGGLAKVGAKIAGKELAADGLAAMAPGMISSFGAITVALGAVATAVGLVVAGYQAWLRLTPEGHLKQAKAIAEAMNDVAASTKKAKQELQDAETNYKQYNDAVKNASTTEERSDAIKSRNEYITALVEQNEILAKYVNTSQENGELVLTINEEELAAAVETVSEGAAKAAISANFADALVAGKQADVYEARLRRADVNLKNRTIRDYDENGMETTRQLTDAEYAKFASYAQSAANARAEQRSAAAQAYQQELTGQGLADDIATLLGGALADTFNEDKYLKQINAQRSTNWWNGEATKAQLRASYKDLYGVEADSKMGRKELAQAVAQAQVDQQNEANRADLIEMLKGPQKEAYKAALEAWNGQGKMAKMSLDNINIEGISDADLIKGLGLDALTADELEAFANALGTDTKGLLEHAKVQLKNNKEIQQQRKADIYDRMLKQGMDINAQDRANIRNLNPEQSNMVLNTIDSAEGLISQETYQGLLRNLISGSINEELAANITSLFNSIDLNDPIGAFTALVEAEKKGDEALQPYIDNIRTTNEELFTASNLVQSFITSSDYDEITESLQEYIKENGRISADNIEEVAKSSVKLKQLLDSNKVSAKELANALTLIEQGKIGFEVLTDAMLKALGAGTSFEEMIEEVDNWIKNFDKGKDLKEGTEHMIECLDELAKYADNWEFGNEPTQNLYEYIFGTEGDDSYENLLERFGTDFDGLENYIEGRVEQVKGWAENEGLGGIQEALAQGLPGLSQIQGSGGQFFNWDVSQFSTTTEAIEQVAKALGVTQEAAEAFILSWQTHMPALKTEWNKLNYKTQLQAFIENLDTTKAITEQQLEAIGAAVGKTAKEVREDLKTLSEEKGIKLPIIVNWKDEDGNDLTGERLKEAFAVKFGGNDFKNAYDFSGYLEGLTQSLKNGFTGIDFDGLINKLLADGLSQSQANEMADKIVGSIEKGLLTKTIKIPNLEDGVVKMVDFKVAADSTEGLEAAINAAQEKANYNILSQQLAASGEGFTQDFIETFSTNYETAITDAATLLQDSLNGVKTIKLEDGMTTAGKNAAIKTNTAFINAFSGATSELQRRLNSTPFRGTLILTGTGTGARGGLVKSFAGGSGDLFLQPGFALTGEEGPEIVWNKNQGYAYVTGRNGPEFQNLQPGDRVFNAAETSRIFRNSSFTKGGYFKSYDAGGGWPDGDEPGGGGGGRGSSGKKESTWYNDLDWLYNLMEDIAELERRRNEIQARQELYLKDINKTGADLYKLTLEELTNLETQLENEEMAQYKRLQEMVELFNMYPQYSDYVWWNAEDQTIEIDWDKIEAIQDQDTYNEVMDLIKRAEDIQKKMDDAEETIWDIKKAIQELKERYLQKYLEFQNRVLNAVVASYQAVIDDLSSLNDTINETNNSILNSIQNEIDLQRQIRDNTDTEKNITNLETRLAYLQRDTSGANAAEIREIEKQLEEERKKYSDSLIDQEVDRLSQANDDARAQREKQIEIMQAQLDYLKESGGLWAEVAKLIADGFDENGSLIQGSALELILRQNEDWDAMSQSQRENWANELILETNQVGAHLLEISKGLDSISQGVWALVPEHSYTGTKTTKYASGGLNTYTGLAQLDGTPSEPEYVLNARQTDAFLRLVDVLPAVMNGTTPINNSYGGNIYLDLTMNVDEIASDYDVDSIANRVKEIIYDASSYRNVNSLNFSR